ncbi:hypothetical protein EMCG_05874 [[Emmonsia] crescens]|uniref:Uncharacterized protein n=1 Tax=[Emmonsia] crescens TaxID=73230 RepID=A0A0G2ICV5_9EURO|nr:hypothetical protein EMCG_05874 [Emmonsia crescens UAMH 3008]
MLLISKNHRAEFSKFNSTESIMQFNTKIMALALLFAPLALTAPADSTLAAPAESTVDLIPVCSPGSYKCHCLYGGNSCWVDVCNALGQYQLSARCRNRPSPEGPDSCRDGPNGTAFCI